MAIPDNWMEPSPPLAVDELYGPSPGSPRVLPPEPLEFELILSLDAAEQDRESTQEKAPSGTTPA
jgi:hypothetical protein